MTIPQLMVKTWKGAVGEFFTHRDMGRIERNLNICSEELSQPTVNYLETTRASQFRYDEAQKIEDHIQTLSSALGLSIETERNWGMGRTVSYVDFERWEAGLWDIYTALGGIGERIPADKHLMSYRTTLFHREWTGDGPYSMVIRFPEIRDDVDCLAFVTHTASIEQRISEYNANIRAKPDADGYIKFEVLSIKPRTDIPVTVAIGGLQMNEVLDLPASAWQGSGPWTQTVSLSVQATDAVIGQWEGMTATQVEQMMRGMLHVSAINGTQVTIRVIGEKPSVDLNPMVLYDSTEVE